MTDIIKPLDINKIWASGGDVITPADTKIATGWGVEIPPRQYFNYIDKKQDQAIAHINQHGVAVWDGVTEYQASKSYAQGPTNGTIYRCVATNTNHNPETDVTNTYWQIAFASAVDSYKKTDSDARYLIKAQNLADLSNTATARTNLSVYSKTEVDGKTTVASTAQAQAFVSNTTLLTPLRLAEAMQGANQSLALSGYQKLPGGLILQWGIYSNATAVAGTFYTVNLPITFPTGGLRGVVTNLTSSTTNTDNVSVGAVGAATVQLIFKEGGNRSAAFFALGY